MSTDKIQKARELVLSYIATHNISDKLNRAINEVCKSRPQDPWLFLNDIVSDWAKDVPFIDRLVAKQGIDKNGNPSLQVQLYGKVSSAHSRPPRYLGVQNVYMITTLNDDSKEDRDPYSDCQVLMEKVSEFLSPALRSIRLNEHNKIDEMLIKMYQDLGDESNAYHLIPAISTLIASVTAQVVHLPMYQYLTRTRLKLDKSKSVQSIETNIANIDVVDYILPNLMVPIYQSSDSNEYPNIYLVPKSTLKAMDRVRIITEIADKIKTENVEFDDLETLLKFIAIVVEDKASVCVSFSHNPSCIDYSGMDSAGLVSYFEKLVENHPEIGYLEDPMHESDVDGAKLLTEKLREKVVVIGNKAYSDDSSLIESLEEGMQNEQNSAVMVSTSGLFTMSYILKISNMMQQYKDKAVLMVSDDDFVDNGIAGHSVDLATACGANMIRLPMPDGGQETAMKYNRWLMIADELGVDMDMEDVMEEEEDHTLANGGPVEKESTEVELESGSTMVQETDPAEKTEDLP